MREIRLSGSEGGAGSIPVPTPIPGIKPRAERMAQPGTKPRAERTAHPGIKPRAERTAHPGKASTGKN